MYVMEKKYSWGNSLLKKINLIEQKTHTPKLIPLKYYHVAA